MICDATLLECSSEPALAAGEFLDWLAGINSGIWERAGSDVPCDGCVACCRGSYFIHVGTEEPALERIPAALLFPAPGRAAEWVLGYDSSGQCPMLEANGCSIYADRPRTCRAYDCRIFAATGIAEPGPERQPIMARAARWRFDYASSDARFRHEALKAAGRFVLGAESLADVLPTTATQLAMLIVDRAEPIVALVRRQGIPLTKAAGEEMRAALSD